MLFLTSIAVFVAFAVIFSRVSRLEAEFRKLEDQVNRRGFVEEVKATVRPSVPVVVRAPAPELVPESVPELAPEPIRLKRKVAQVLRAEPQLQLEAEISSALRKPEPQPTPEPAGPNLFQRIVSGGFEELFGQRLPIWAGGITLAVAGLFMVKYSIDQGLLSPTTRIVLGLIFSAALVVGAEVTRRWKATAIDVRIPQALAGAGIAAAYSAVLVGINVYEIIGRIPGFFGLAAITAAALGLAIRFGAPSAVLGLVGGLAAPALIGAAEPNVPGLALYLTLAIGGLTGVARKQRWSWLAIGALVGGFGWGALMLLTNVWDGLASTALGGYLLVLGLAVPFFAFGKDGGRLFRALPVVFAAVQVSILVMKGGYSPLEWSFYGLLSIGVIVLAQMDKRLALLPPVAMVVAQATMAAWPEPQLPMLLSVAGGILALFAGPPLFRMWKEHGIIANAVQATGALVGTWMIFIAKLPYDSMSEDVQGVIALGFAAIAGACAWRGLALSERKSDARFPILVAASALLTLFGIVTILPAIWWGPLLTALALIVSVVALKSEEKLLKPVVWVGAIIGLASLVLQWETAEDIGRVANLEYVPALWTDCLRWFAGAALFAALRWFEKHKIIGPVFESVAAALFGVGLAQIVPAAALPVAYAASFLTLIEANRRWSSWSPFPALGVFAVFVLGWALEPFAVWVAGTLQSLFGEPFVAEALPHLADTTNRLLLPAAVLGIAAWRIQREWAPKLRIAVMAASAVMAAIGAFFVFKQATGLSYDNFSQRGFGERVLLTQLLFAGGVACWRFQKRHAVLRWAAMGLAGLALSRTILFDLIVYNPMLRMQAVGDWPVVNLLAPAFLFPVAWLAYAKRQDLRLSGKFGPALAVLSMALIFAFAITTLRQAFQGSIFSEGMMSQAEDIGYSLVAIGLGVGFLRWGIHVRERTWRITSLLLMLGAVAKVFLLDASGLEGLLRIGSFVALGFSLIGIGWLYSRYLRSDDEGDTVVPVGA
jgi:uncharacterized membrane protein